MTTERTEMPKASGRLERKEHTEAVTHATPSYVPCSLLIFLH
jgi:hypothetical protein